MQPESQINTMNKRSFGITLAGWILILYPVYVFIYPIVFSILLSIFNPELVEMIISEKGPAGGGMFLQATGASPIAIVAIQIAALLTAVLIPLCSFVSGIMILKLKNSARKFVLIIFSLDIILRGFLLIMTFSNTYLKHLLMKDISSTIFFFMIIILDIFFVWFFLRSKVLSEFVKS